MVYAGNKNYLLKSEYYLENILFSVLFFKQVKCICFTEGLYKSPDAGYEPVVLWLNQSKTEITLIF